MTTTAAPTFIYTRPLTEDERSLVAHIRMWGSDGYPVARVGSRHWSWSYRSCSSPLVFPTKREATSSFERFHEVLLSCYAYERYQASS